MFLPLISQMDSLDFVLEKRTEELELGNFGSCAQPDVDAEVVIEEQNGGWNSELVLDELFNVEYRQEGPDKEERLFDDGAGVEGRVENCDVNVKTDVWLAWENFEQYWQQA